MNKVLEPDWSTSLNGIVEATRRELLVVTPYYSNDTIKRILELCDRNVQKRFMLALNKYEASAGYQSIDALRALVHYRKTEVRLISNLHAKVIISDRHRAIVTSSNLTTAGLERNIEYGLEVDDPATVRSLVDSLEYYWRLGETLSSEELKQIEKDLPKTNRHVETRRAYGPEISIHKPIPRWILVHSLSYVDSDYSNPKEELLELAHRLPANWHWRRANPIREGGPYILLFAYDWRVFARGTCLVTHEVDEDMKAEGYNFAFRLLTLEFPREVALQDLPLGNRAIYHRDLIRLDDDVLLAYNSLAK